VTAALSTPRKGVPNFARVFFVGGYYSFRALFEWLSPWIYVPTLVVTPLFQILFFVYLGRSAHGGSDSFYVIGNALVAMSLATFFGVGFALDGERESQTLVTIVGSPANRLALFSGRALPVAANGVFVAASSFALSSLLLDVRVPSAALAPLLVTMLVAAASTAAFGFVIGSFALRYRSLGVVANLALALMLIFTGANVPRTQLPHWMQLVGDALPLTRTIQAARELVAGGSLSQIARLLLVELALAAAYGIAGYRLLRWFEQQARRSATLEVF
jgi:ABC-2 type transport system permease protein